jgi:hypothetical protein
MSRPGASKSSSTLLIRLLDSNSCHPTFTTDLASLEPDLLEYLYGKAADLLHRSVIDARELLDVALVLEHPESAEHRRRLIERADDELASAQRWGELAANARFCREHPELARELAGDSLEGEVPSADAADAAKPSA